MKSFFKSISVILGTSLLLSGLAACSGTDTANQDGGVTTVTVWSGDSHSKDVYQQLINEYNNGEGKEKGIKIDYQVKEGDTISQNVELALQGGNAPDFFKGGELGKLVENNYIAAIEDLPGGEEYLKTYQDKGVLREDVNIYNDKTYSVPVAATTQGLIYNKDMFRAAGLVDENGEPTPPETLEEFREYAKVLTNPEKKEYGIILPMKWSNWFTSDIQSPVQSSAGHLGYDPVTGEYDYTVYAPVMETFLGIKEDGSYLPGADGLDNDAARARFAAGNIGMKIGYSFDVGVLNDQFPAQIDWGVAPFPVADANNKYKQRIDYSASFYMNQKSLETVGAEKMMEVFKFFTGNDFVTELYKAGVEIPYDWEIVKDVQLENPKTGWKEFCELVSISSWYPRSPKTDMSGQVTITDRFLNDVWTGHVTPLEMLTQYTEDITDGRNRYYQTHPDENPDEYLDPAWDIRR